MTPPTQAPAESPQATLDRQAQLWKAAPAGMRRVVLIRHGETDWNASKRFQGHTDIALNARGREQAQLLAAHLCILEAHMGQAVAQACISSDLERALHTAQTLWVNKSKAIDCKPGLRERNYGQLAGLTAEEMATHHPEAFKGMSQRDPQHEPPEGESLNRFNQRVLDAFFSALADHPGQDLMLVAHGGVLDCIYRHCMDEPLHTPRSWLLPNAALNVLWVQAGSKPQVALWADQSHLNVGLGNTGLDEVDGRVA